MELITVRSENIFITNNSSNIQRLTQNNILQNYKDVFSGNGRLEGELHLEIDPSVTPVRMPLRKLPIAVKDKVKAELESLTKSGIISPMNKPSEWISALLVVTKPDGRIRICIDPKPLNKALKRNHHCLPVIDDIIPELEGAKIFSTVDAKDGFWHVCLY